MCWLVGENLFSAWRDQTEAEQRAIYDELGFDSFTKVEPFHPTETTEKDVIDFTDDEAAAWLRGIRDGQQEAWRYRPVTVSAEALQALVDLADHVDVGQSITLAAYINHAKEVLSLGWRVPFLPEFRPIVNVDGMSVDMKLDLRDRFYLGSEA